MNKALLDTDIYSEALKAVDQIVVRNATAYRSTFGTLTISVITVMEVVSGFQRVQADKRIESFLNAVALEEVLPFDHATAELAGRINGELERVGQSIGVADPMIAAIALQNGLELVTGNTAHYQRIQQLGYPLVVLNWRV